MMSNGAAIAGHEKITAGPRTTLRSVAARGYRWLLLGFLLLGVAQIFLAGLRGFSLQGQTLAGSARRHGLRAAPRRRVQRGRGRGAHPGAALIARADARAITRIPVQRVN